LPITNWQLPIGKFRLTSADRQLNV
jgi:hypothetical protein